ncbi:MAG TPA: hypothetical protein VNS02_02565 [Rhizobiaceae bacterium]|nr:hypothetical protein [Rhizobiaceae bacterium]
MPDPHRKKDYLISQAERNARYALIWCRYCKQRRYFLLADLREAFGDIDCDSIVDHYNWKCTGCDGNGRIDLRLEDPRASDGGTLRRLVRIDTIRRPVWRDEPL